jgi:oligosaccharide repeat unit polymerase
MQIVISIILSLLIVGLIIGTNAVILLNAKSYANPALVFSVFFGIQMLLCLLFLQEDIGGVYYGFFWIYAGVSAFALGSYLVSRRRSGEPKIVRSNGGAQTAKGYDVYDKKTMNITLAALLLLSFTQPISIIYRLGYNFIDLFNPYMLFEMNHAAAQSRYVEHSSSGSPLMQIFLVLVYLLPLIGGWNFVYSKKRRTKILCVCMVLPSLFVLFTQNTKAAFIGSVLLFICSFITAKFQKSGSFYRLRAKRLRLIFLLAAVFLLLNYISFFLREGDVTWSLFGAISYKTFNYTLGQIPAFNHWLSNSFVLFPQTFGLKTLYSVTDSLGIMKRVQGIYPDKLVTAHLSTNVYTAFRPLIDDFSAIGALVVLFLTGALSGFCFGRLKAGTARCLDIAFITAMYFYIFYSFITSPWAYVSYTAAAVLFLCYLWLIRGHVIFVGRIKEPLI